LRADPAPGRPTFDEHSANWVDLNDNLPSARAPPTHLGLERRLQHLYLNTLGPASCFVRSRIRLCLRRQRLARRCAVSPEEKVLVYFSLPTAESPLERHLYSVSIYQTPSFRAHAEDHHRFPVGTESPCRANAAHVLLVSHFLRAGESPSLTVALNEGGGARYPVSNTIGPIILCALPSESPATHSARWSARTAQTTALYRSSSPRNLEPWGRRYPVNRGCLGPLQPAFPQSLGGGYPRVHPNCILPPDPGSESDLIVIHARNRCSGSRGVHV